MSTTYTYRAYWREQGATDWNEIESPAPITWNEETVTASQPVGVAGGQCVGVLYRIEFSYNNDQGVRSFIEQIAQGKIAGTYSEPRNFGQTEIGYVLEDGQGFQTRFNQVTRTAPGDGSPSVRVLFRIDGQPDNCGDSPDYSPGGEGGCKTTFSTGLVIIKPECIEVTLNPPECECCKELLPKANAILARLG